MLIVRCALVSQINKHIDLTMAWLDAQRGRGSEQMIPVRVEVDEDDDMLDGAS